MKDFRKISQELAAKLIPHTTSVQNVLLIQAVLEEQYTDGAASMMRLMSKDAAAKVGE